MMTLSRQCVRQEMFLPVLPGICLQFVTVHTYEYHDRTRRVLYCRLSVIIEL